MPRWRPFPALICASLMACGAQDEQEGTGGVEDACLPPNRIVEERCLEPGVQDDGCPAGEVGLDDGSCRPAGVPPALCAEGFAHDGDVACEPILPVEDCPPGQMAVPGETACHPVMVCGAGPWGDIPVDGTTVYVDAAYAAGFNDGTAGKPYTAISDAVAAASSGALIAVAAGSYDENILIDKPLRLWGVCPDLVHLAGQGGEIGALTIIAGASGTEVVGLDVTTEDYTAVFISGAENVTLDRLWIHDAPGRGVGLQSDLGATSVTLRHTLVERNHELGVFVQGAQATIDGTVVRDTFPRQSDQSVGRGLGIQPNPLTGASAILTLSGSLVERNHEIGVFVAGSVATIEGTVVRDTFPQQSDADLGRGIIIQAEDDAPATAAITASLVERNHDVGVYVYGATATIEGTVVRDTLPLQTDLTGGRGVNIQPAPNTPSSAALSASVVERNHEIGVLALGSEVTIDGTVVRDTLPRQSDQIGGRGFHTQADPVTGTPAMATISSSRLERNHAFGILATGAAATIDGTAVRDTLPQAADGLFGDGIAIFSELGPASAALSSSVSEHNARAGLASFGAEVSLTTLGLRCSAFDLAGEPHLNQPFTFTDLGSNLCGCEPAPALCKAISAGLAPPEAIESSP